MTKKMTRREALKTLGLAIGTVTASVSSVSGLTSCKEEKKRLIFYFTATGNSLLGPDCLYLGTGRGQAEVLCEDGILTPIYGSLFDRHWGLPRHVA